MTQITYEPLPDGHPSPPTIPLAPFDAREHMLPEDMAELNDIVATLAERGSRYGSFDEHARITQAIKRAYQDSPNWVSLPDNMKEALEMNAHKVGRILNGDPFFHDSWHDIIGYTKLVADGLVPEAG